MKNHRKGQITIVNLIQLAVAIVILVMLAPVLNNLIEGTVVTLQATPNEYTPLVVSVLRLIVAAVALAIIFTAFNYAVPRREGY